MNPGAECVRGLFFIVLRLGDRGQFYAACCRLWVSPVTAWVLAADECFAKNSWSSLWFANSMFFYVRTGTLSPSSHTPANSSASDLPYAARWVRHEDLLYAQISSTSVFMRGSIFFPYQFSTPKAPFFSLNLVSVRFWVRFLRNYQANEPVF